MGLVTRGPPLSAPSGIRLITRLTALSSGAWVPCWMLWERIRPGSTVAEGFCSTVPTFSLRVSNTIRASSRVLRVRLGTLTMGFSGPWLTVRFTVSCSRISTPGSGSWAMTVPAGCSLKTGSTLPTRRLASRISASASCWSLFRSVGTFTWEPPPLRVSRTV